MNATENARTIPADSLVTRPIVLTQDEIYRYGHHAAYGLPGLVVMFGLKDEPAGCEAGTHDGIRDGAYAGGRSKFFRGYVGLADWIAAGNSDPRSAP